MAPAATEAAREKIWIALSDLYLDIEIESSIEPCARVLAESPFPRDELKRILFDEVHPLLVFNLLSVVGDWAGFDEAWLCASLRRQRSHWSLRAAVGRYCLRRYPRTLWPRLDEIIVRLRSSESAT